VVALDRMDYIDKIERYLSDTDIYILLQCNPINKLTENLKKILKFFSWLKNGYISKAISIHSSIQLMPSYRELTVYPVKFIKLVIRYK